MKLHHARLITIQYRNLITVQVRTSADLARLQTTTTKIEQLVAQKLRYPSKEFQWLGDVKKATLFGQHLWREKGKMVVVTEGEIDALSVSKLWDNKYPVVSIKTGAAGAKKDISKELEWLESFDSVVLCFDQDDAGKKAASECARLFSPNKAKICSLPLKDANEMLVAGKYKELTDCIWSAKPYRPDGIVCGTDIWDVIQQEDNYVTVNYPFESLNVKTHGLRKGELVTNHSRLRCWQKVLSAVTLHYTYYKKILKLDT